MRLARILDNGELSLEEHIGQDIPAYAILSHTWGRDEDEVTFRDLTEGTGQEKAGYRKLDFCRKQTSEAGLEFFWVDTCCIDKSSSAELSEAINSMFRWYQNAAICYVYLSDVSVSSDDPESSVVWLHAFHRSRWFKRGWTLQELIGPEKVEFFSVEGGRLGDKRSLTQAVHEITRIPVPVLQGRAVDDYSVDERMSWAEGRTTKREEDAVYSLLGMFDIYMPLIYGEGRQRASLRLQKEIRELMEGGMSAYLSSYTMQSARSTSHSVSNPSSNVEFEVWKRLSANGNHDGGEHAQSDRLSAMPMWPGNVLRTRFPEAYLRQRDRISALAKYGRWDEVFPQLEIGIKEYGENWVNAVRIRSPHEADKLSFWTPLHQAAYMRAPINVIKHLIDAGALRTLRTKKASSHSSIYNDSTAADIARDMGHHHLLDILAPVIHQSIPHRVLLRLQALFHEMIRADWEDAPALILPDLVPLTELRVPEMWFPLRAREDGGGLVGYCYRLEGRELVVTKVGVEGTEPVVYRIR